MIHNVRGAGFVKLPDFVRTTIFRWTSIAFAACLLLFSAFVYWEAAADMLARMDAAIVEESLVIAADAPDRRQSRKRTPGARGQRDCPGRAGRQGRPAGAGRDGRPGHCAQSSERKRV